MTNNENDEEINKLFNLYKMKFDEKNKDGNHIGSITFEKYVLSLISILLKAVATIHDEPWTIEYNSDYSIQNTVDLSNCSMILEDNNENISKILEPESKILEDNKHLNSTGDVYIDDCVNMQELLEESKFWTAKKMKCLQDSEIEMSANPDWSINNIEIIRNRNILDISDFSHDDKIIEYKDIDSLFKYYNQLYLGNFELYLIKKQREGIIELSTFEVNLLEEIINMMLEYSYKNPKIEQLEHSKYFIGYPCLNPDITYNIILNNHYKKMDLIVDTIIRNPTNEITQNECLKLLPIPKIIHKRKIFDKKERLMFLNGISEKQYNIDCNNCNKAMTNLASVIVAHVGFDTANKQSLNVLANVTSTYIKKLAVIMKKDLANNQLLISNTKSINHSLEEIYVNGGFGEIIKYYEYDIIDRRNKLLKDCEQLQHFIDQYFINPCLVINKIKNQYVTFEDLKLKSVNEKNEYVTKLKTQANEFVNIEVEQCKAEINNFQLHEIFGYCSLIDSIKDYIYTSDHIKKKIIKFIIKRLLEYVNYNEQDEYEFYSKELKKDKDLFYSTFKEDISTNIEIKHINPEITNANKRFKPSTSSHTNNVDFIKVNTLSSSKNDMLTEDKRTDIGSKTEGFTTTNIENEQTKPKIFYPNNLFKPSTSSHTNNVDCIKVNTLSSSKNDMLTEDKRTDIGSKTEGFTTTNIENEQTKPKIFYPNNLFKPSTSSHTNNVDCIKVNTLSSSKNDMITEDKRTDIGSKTEGFTTTNIENEQTKPKIFYPNNLFKPSTSSDPNYVECIVNTTSTSRNVTEKNKDAPLKENTIEIESKTKGKKSIHSKIKPTKTEIFTDPNLVERMLTDETYQNKICFKFMLTLLNSGIDANFINHEFFIEDDENETEKESKTEIKQTKPKIDNTHNNIKPSTLSDSNNIECMKFNELCINKILFNNLLDDLFILSYVSNDNNIFDDFSEINRKKENNTKLESKTVENEPTENETGPDINNTHKYMPSTSSKTVENEPTENETGPDINNTHKYMPSTSSKPNNVKFIKPDLSCSDKIILKILLDKLLPSYLDDDIFDSSSIENNEDIPFKENETNKNMEEDEIVSEENETNIESNTEENETAQNKQTEPKVDNTYKHVKLSDLLDPNGVECIKANADYATGRKMQYVRFTNNTKKTNTNNIKNITRTFNNDIMNSDLLKPLLFEEDNEDNYNLLSNKSKCSSVNDKQTLQKPLKSNPKSTENIDKNNCNDIKNKNSKKILQCKYLTNKPESAPKDTIEQIKQQLQKLFKCCHTNDIKSQDINMSNSKSTTNFNEIEPSTSSETKPLPDQFNSILEKNIMEHASSEINASKPLLQMMLKDFDNDFKCWKDSQVINKISTKDTLTLSDERISNDISTLVLGKVKQHSSNQIIKKMEMNDRKN